MLYINAVNADSECCNEYDDCRLKMLYLLSVTADSEW